MEIHLANCNNISTGTVSLTEGRLNLKYAINGTGKSTLARVIECAAKHDSSALKELTPYSFIGDNEEEHQPSVTGVPEDVNIAVFNESYVNQYVFLDDELLKNSFEVFVKTENYEQKLAEINKLIANIRAIFEDNPDLESLLQDLNSFRRLVTILEQVLPTMDLLQRGWAKVISFRTFLPDWKNFQSFCEMSKTQNG